MDLSSKEIGLRAQADHPGYFPTSNLQPLPILTNGTALGTGGGVRKAGQGQIDDEAGCRVLSGVMASNYRSLSSSGMIEDSEPLIPPSDFGQKIISASLNKENKAVGSSKPLEDLHTPRSPTIIDIYQTIFQALCSSFDSQS
jgi:hypothetical protein